MSGEDSTSGSGQNNNVVPYIMVIRKLILVKFQSLMEILKSSLGGKPTSTVMSWV